MDSQGWGSPHWDKIIQKRKDGPVLCRSSFIRALFWASVMIILRSSGLLGDRDIQPRILNAAELVGRCKRWTDVYFGQKA